MYKVSPRPTIGCNCMVLVLIWGIAGTVCRERAPTTVTGNRDCDFVYKKREWVLAEEHGDLVFDEANPNGTYPISQLESGTPPNFSFTGANESIVLGAEMARQQFRYAEQNEVFRSFGEDSPEADQNDIIREKREYTRWIGTLLSLWIAAGPDWMT